jgi:hypothetical protein
MRGLQICIRKDRECVVADAVPFEPVSTVKSLLAGKFVGNFSEFDPEGALGLENLDHNSTAYSEIP